jgi:hypothetical protein
MALDIHGNAPARSALPAATANGPLGRGGVSVGGRSGLQVDAVGNLAVYQPDPGDVTAGNLYFPVGQTLQVLCGTTVLAQMTQTFFQVAQAIRPLQNNTNLNIGGLGTGSVLVPAAASGSIALIVRGAASQSVSPFVVQDSGLATLFAVTQAGFVTAASIDATKLVGAMKTLTVNAVLKTFSDSPYTVAATDAIIVMNASGGASTVNLPSAAANTGRVIHIKKNDSSGNAVTVASFAGDTVQGTASPTLAAQYNSMTLYSYGGTTWLRLCST